VPLLVTTLAVSGFSNTPTWSIEVQWSDGKPSTAQADAILPYALQGVPKYTFNGPIYTWNNNVGGYNPNGTPGWTGYQLTATGVSGITLYTSYVSAQTELVIVTADDGKGTRCSTTLSVVVTARVGPTVDVGPGQTFATYNDFLTAWWPARSTYNGATVNLHAGIDAATDFSYSPSGSGGGSGYVNGWPPGPVTLQSPTGGGKTVLDFLGGNNGSSQAGIVANNFDLTMIDLVVQNVNGDGNSGGVYMTAQTPGNVTLQGVEIYNCNMGLMNGDGTARHAVVNECVIACNGYGSTEENHNIYVNSAGRVDVTNSWIICSTGDHGLKSRARITTATGNHIIQGAQSFQGGSPVDTPLGGIVTITNNIIGGALAYDDNNPILWAPGAEASAQYPIWPGSSTEVSGNTFYSIACPAGTNAGPSASFGPIIAIQYNCSISPTDGSPIQLTYTGNSFYNLSAANWVIPGYSGFGHSGSDYYLTGGPAPINGGGNVTLTTYTQQVVLDPTTGSPPVNLPALPIFLPGSGAGNGLPALVGSSGLIVDFVAATAPAINTVLATLTAYDASGDPMTGVTYTMIASYPTGSLKFGTAGAIETANSSTPDAPYWANVQATGTGVPQGGGSPTTITTNEQWTPIMVGTGFVAAS